VLVNAVPFCKFLGENCYIMDVDWEMFINFSEGSEDIIIPTDFFKENEFPTPLPFDGFLEKPVEPLIELEPLTYKPLTDNPNTTNY
jgi:hypothetical protein